jgi:hypothetical protein
VSVEKFLNQRAINIAVGGNYTLAKWLDPQGKPRTFACRTTRISPFRMIVDVPVIGKIGDPISSYFSAFGKLEGFISDTMRGARASSPGWKRNRSNPACPTAGKRRASFRQRRTPR